MSKKIVIIGAGINGLVAANYLQRQGYQVSLIEAKDKVGGACTSEIIEIGDQQHLYPQNNHRLVFYALLSDLEAIS